MYEAMQWGPWIVSAAALALSGLSLGFGLRARRSAGAQARRVAESVSRKAVGEYWRSTERAQFDHDRRIKRLEDEEATRHRTRHILSIARTGGEPDQDAA